jgi:hypothetical protein
MLKSPISKSAAYFHEKAMISKKFSSKNIAFLIPGENIYYMG